MATGRAWVLNLDADLELGAIARGARYAPTDVVRAAMAPHVATLAGTLLHPDDLLVDERSAPGVAAGRSGRAFCPTPRAVALLARAGARPEPHPSAEVLARVNGRVFAAGLGQTLPGATFVNELEAALAALAHDSPLGGAWRVKRAFGMAGRGQRTLAPGTPSGADLAFLRGGLAEGGLQIEPAAVLEEELALHGVVDPAGSAAFGRLVVQECDAKGQWLRSRLAVEDALGAEHRETLFAEARRTSAALAEAGYHGPFGIDAFVYIGPDGDRCLNPRSEINARYSMGFAVGYGPTAPSGDSR
jgi:hypothetical protein